MALYLCQQEIDLSKLYRWAGKRRIFSGILDEGYALHAFLTENLGEHAPQPFRLIHTAGADNGTLYGYSKHGAALINQTATEIAQPDYREIASAVIEKQMPSSWRVGRRFGFEIKVRPTTRFRNEHGKMVERDAFLSQVAGSPAKVPIDRKQVYTEWLGSRLNKNGACLSEDSSVSMPAFQRNKIVRVRGARGGSEGPDCVLRGVLEVTNEAAFMHMLANGAGRHKAYGYGMLLLRPARVRKTC